MYRIVMHKIVEKRCKGRKNHIILSTIRKMAIDFV